MRKQRHLFHIKNNVWVWKRSNITSFLKLNDVLHSGVFTLTFIHLIAVIHSQLAVRNLYFLMHGYSQLWVFKHVGYHYVFLINVTWVNNCIWTYVRSNLSISFHLFYIIMPTTFIITWEARKHDWDPVSQEGLFHQWFPMQQQAVIVLGQLLYPLSRYSFFVDGWLKLKRTKTKPAQGSLHICHISWYLPSNRSLKLHTIVTYFFEICNQCIL